MSLLGNEMATDQHSQIKLDLQGSKICNCPGSQEQSKTTQYSLMVYVFLFFFKLNCSIMWKPCVGSLGQYYLNTALLFGQMAKQDMYRKGEFKSQSCG